MFTPDMEKDWMESRGLGIRKCHIIEKLESYMNEDGIYDIQKHQSEACHLRQVRIRAEQEKEIEPC